MKGSIDLKINLVKIMIRNQSIAIEDVQDQYHRNLRMAKEALHPIEMGAI